MSVIDDKLADLGITLPPPFTLPKPNRTGCVRVGNLLFVSGHGALGITPPEGVRLHGKLGLDMTVEEGQVVARYAMIKMLGTIKGAIGDLDRVRRVVRLFGMVNCAPDFHFMPAVIDGASDLLYDLFGERGVHARSAIGVASLPYGSAVEINAEFLVAARTGPYRLRRAFIREETAIVRDELALQEVTGACETAVGDERGVVVRQAITDSRLAAHALCRCDKGAFVDSVGRVAGPEHLPAGE